MRYELTTALKRLSARPAYALTAVGMLTIAIASNVAVFTVLSRTLFRPLPFTQPSALVMVQATHLDSSGEPREYQAGPVHSRLKDGAFQTSGAGHEFQF